MQFGKNKIQDTKLSHEQKIHLNGTIKAEKPQLVYYLDHMDTNTIN